MSEADKTDLTHRYDVSIWVDMLEDILFCVPQALRLEVLQALVEKETERRKKPFRLICFNELMSADFLNYNAVKEAKSLVIQVLVRNITNNDSPEGAAKTLFREHRTGTGSRWLPDYLSGLPGVKIDRKRCAAISDTAGKTKLNFEPYAYGDASNDGAGDEG